MKLAHGTRLGPYEIEHAIGAGGMGVVYRADDSRLGRKVAIKILPHAQGEHFRRFEREARTIGGLNHPNLLTLFDVGDHDGTPFLVTEMLEGESLRGRLARGKLPLRQAIQVAADVARGLAAAHDAGVVHRDVKPDNIFLTAEGRTKILDFGIAKLTRSTQERPAVDLAHEDTVTPTTADTGVIIGTPGYMAPEQLDGGTVDERSDIFSLGVVLYEMICGHRAFVAQSAVEESYAILKTTPDPPKGATKALARVVLRCLEKRKDARFQSANDLAFALDELDASTDPVARISKVTIEQDPQTAPTIRERAPTAARNQRRRRRWLVAGLSGIVLLLAGVMIGRLLAGPRGLEPAWPSVVEGGVTYQRVTYHSQPKWFARLSPDGQNVFYTAQRGGREEVLRSQITQPSILPTNIPGRLLDISHRGELAVVVDEVAGIGGTLTRGFEGTGPRAVLDQVRGAAWMPDGDNLAVLRGELRLEYPPGKAIVERTTGKLDLLAVSPRGDRIAFVDHPASADTMGVVTVIDLTGKELVKSAPQQAIEGLAWSLDGKEVWFSRGPEIVALAAGGKERVVLRGTGRLVLIDIRAGKILVAPSDIRLKMFTGPINGPMREVGWFDSSVVEAVSADGQTIAFLEGTGTGQTADGYAQFLRRGDAPATLIGHGYRFTLLPDASAMIGVAGETKLVRIPNGVGEPVSIPLGKIAKLDVSDKVVVSWNGRHVVVRGAEAGAAMRLWLIDLDKPDPQPITADHRGGPHPITPDGRLVAIARAAGGIELIPVAGEPPSSIEGPLGEKPLSFTADGTALFVTHLTGQTIEVDRITLANGERTPWTRITPEQMPFYYSVMLDADGDVVTYSTNADASDLYVLEPPDKR
ncbi:MAG: protein kinase [Deltaproteobacteria bacterium]|nr:protein kinase [Deltaproteobacteria bacterium]MDQ3300582.1 protein kinase [Myxococcota bacterium]